MEDTHPNMTLEQHRHVDVVPVFVCPQADQ